MELTEFKLEYITQKNEGNVPVIVVAAGSSTRMNGISKQFVSLCGIPAIIHTLSAFERCKLISEIILVTRDEYISEMRLLADKYGISKLGLIVSGGKTRQESVKNGLNQVKAAEFVLIHDGARPLLSENIIKSVIEKMQNCDCVIPAVPVKDTVKRIDAQGRVEKTVDRDNLCCVQTPQGVNVKKYLEIIEKNDISVFTDDASAFENAGFDVQTVAGDYKNIKLTTRDDIELAEFYLQKGEAEL